MIETKREIMMGTDDILDKMFFGPHPAFRELMNESIKPYFTDRDEQIRVLLGVFAAKEYDRWMEIEEWRAQYMEKLLTPQAGEMAH